MTRGQVQNPDILRISYFLNLTNELNSTVITQSMKPTSLMCGRMVVGGGGGGGGGGDEEDKNIPDRSHHDRNR